MASGITTGAIPQWAELAPIVCEEETDSHARRMGGFYVRARITDHPCPFWPGTERLHGVEQHARLRLSTRTGTDERRVSTLPAVGMVHARIDARDGNASGGQDRHERSVRPLYRIATEMSFGRTGLVGDDREQISSVHQSLEAIEDAVEHANLVRMKCGRDGARLGIAHNVDERAVAVEER
jgi:hypothetical protein